MTEIDMDAFEEDALNRDDTVSLDELEAHEPSQMSKAGIDDMTPVDTFIKMNGSNAYVTEL